MGLKKSEIKSAVACRLSFLLISIEMYSVKICIVWYAGAKDDELNPKNRFNVESDIYFPVIEKICFAKVEQSTALTIVIVPFSRIVFFIFNISFVETVFFFLEITQT